ncbi:unnamed protein product, partial [Ixodes hexagonus]
MFLDELDVSCSSAARIHRLGRPAKVRPVILYFQDYQEKQAVLRNSGKLKGTPIFIQNDYSPETLRKRKLWRSAKPDKDNGTKVSLVNDKLRIDNAYYVWDDSSNARVQVQSASRND